jgi:hypothetical protein
MAMESNRRLKSNEPGAVRRQAVMDEIDVINAETIEKTANGWRWINMFRKSLNLRDINQIL